eukprot:CAMPEP_0204531100 /NCGR_PEP_ID=MMETSP0661-20131031/10986_1 /ASSEMBLY_ACC=CAM_ASM_000606 /TAXON_ID=109239 /ORGANISM="Alexandrium margalefi, Strain AMGDE01CS-322" /LENGTH=635 /DNA_ID=CAMNT_0051537231 /DNA_START=49 /DNA_END=1954 /DNA_ORIENTATION=-
MTQFYDPLSSEAAELNASVSVALAKDNFDEATKLAENAKKPSEAAALRSLAMIELVKASRPGMESAALKAAEEASKKGKTPAGEAAGLALVAQAHVLAKKEAEALKAAEDAVSKFAAIPHPAGEAFALCMVAKAYILAGRNQKAFESANKAVGMLKDAADKKGEAMALHTLLDTYVAMKKYSDAMQAAERISELYSGLGDAFGQGIGKLLSAQVNIANDCKQEGVMDAQEASKLFKKAGANYQMGVVNKLGAEAAIAELMYEDAKEMSERTLMCFKQAGDKHGQASAMIVMSGFYSAEGAYDKATYRAEAAAEAYKKIGAVSEAAAAFRTCCKAFIDMKMFTPKSAGSAPREAMRTATTSLKLYDGAGETESVGYAASTNLLAQAHLAAGDLDAAMDKANEAQALFKKLDYSVGVASTLSTIAQVQQKKGDTFDAVSTAKEAQQMFQENDDDEGAEMAAYLIDLFQAPPEQEGAEPAEIETKAEKKKTGPSVCGLADLIPGGAAAVKPLCAYDAYEGRAATAPGQRRQASAAAEAAGGVTKEEAVFSVRWVGAKNLATSTEAADKSAAGRVIKRGMISTGGMAPSSLMPSKYAGGLAVFEAGCGHPRHGQPAPPRCAGGQAAFSGSINVDASSRL